MNFHLNIVSGWTDERVARLKVLQDEGLSAAQIAADLGGISRNAVIGKLTRMGLSNGIKTGPRVNREGRRVPGSNIKPRMGGLRSLRFEVEPPTPPAPAPPAPNNAKTRADRIGQVVNKRDEIADLDANKLTDLPPEDASKTVKFMALSSITCRWPIGDPRSIDTIRFCGDLPQPDRPYCDRHWRMAHWRRT
jgi:GcrA cell cycle regulator